MTELPSVPLIMRGAQYVRMSTEHQQYSTHNQADKILEYARSRGIEIVRNQAVQSFIQRHEPEILKHFELVVNTVSMEEAVQRKRLAKAP